MFVCVNNIFHPFSFNTCFHINTKTSTLCCRWILSKHFTKRLLQSYIKVCMFAHQCFPTQLVLIQCAFFTIIIKTLACCCRWVLSKHSRFKFKWNVKIQRDRATWLTWLIISCFFTYTKQELFIATWLRLCFTIHKLIIKHYKKCWCCICHKPSATHGHIFNIL